MKDETITNHWVGNSQMKPIYVDELFNRKFVINELGYSLNDDDAIGSSVVVEDETKASVVA